MTQPIIGPFPSLVCEVKYLNTYHPAIFKATWTLSPFQHGFHKLHSCEMQVHIMLDDLGKTPQSVHPNRCCHPQLIQGFDVVHCMSDYWGTIPLWNLR